MQALITGIRTTVVLWILTAILYPGIMLLAGQVIFPYQANGSLIKNSEGQVVGSALIGQTFNSPNYFLSRPSSISYSEGEEAAPTGISGTSNYAPSNPDLISRVQQTQTQLQEQQVQPTADLVYVSGSGLDPHISIEAAQAQVERVAEVRSLPPNQINQLIKQNTDHRFLGIFGEPGVNVLQLNLALDGLERE